MHHLKFKFTGILKVFTQYALILRRSVETAEFIIIYTYFLTLKLKHYFHYNSLPTILRSFTK
jgi:hypothetical protein